MADERAHLDASRERAKERVLQLEQEREAVDDLDVRARGVDEREVGLERGRVAEAVVDDDPRRRAARRFLRRDVERRSPGVGPRVEERARERSTAGPSTRAPASSHGTSRQSEAGPSFTSSKPA